MVSVDGLEVDPLEVDSIILFPAERADFEVLADQAVDRYWMRSRVLKDDQVDVLETLAIVSYSGSNTNVEPTSETRECTAASPCKALNCPFKYFPPSYYTNCIHMDDIERTYASGEHAVYGLDAVEPDIEHFINLQLFGGVTFNGYLFSHPKTPVYQTDSSLVDCSTCSEDAACVCTFRLVLPFNKTVQLVFSNLRPGGGGVDAHPVHIHGHHFAVVKMGFPDYTPGGTDRDLTMNPNTDVECNNRACRRARWTSGRPTMNLRDPPLKDTVIVPAAGYTVVRFRSDNPGPWFIHCHMAHHAHQGGKAMILMEAEDHFPPLPYSMPTCYKDFNLTDKQYDQYLYNAKKALSEGRGFQKVVPYVQPHYRPPNPPNPPPYPGPYPYPPNRRNPTGKNASFTEQNKNPGESNLLFAKVAIATS